MNLLPAWFLIGALTWLGWCVYKWKDEGEITIGDAASLPLFMFFGGVGAGIAVGCVIVEWFSVHGDDPLFRRRDGNG